MHMHLSGDLTLSWWWMCWCALVDVLMVCWQADVRRNLWLQDVMWPHVLTIGVAALGYTAPTLATLAERFALALVHTGAVAFVPAWIHRSSAELHACVPAFDYVEVRLVSDSDTEDADEEDGHNKAHPTAWESEWDLKQSQRLVRDLDLVYVLRVSRSMAAQLVLLQLVRSSVQPGRWSMRVEG
jgi:hypothetical protein